jgi:hypothetical protein
VNVAGANNDFRSRLIVVVAQSCASSLLYDPGGKSALGLLRCSEWGQLSNPHGLDARTNEAPAPANPYVFRHLFSKLNRLALRDIRGTSNDDFDLDRLVFDYSIDHPRLMFFTAIIGLYLILINDFEFCFLC